MGKVEAAANGRDKALILFNLRDFADATARVGLVLAAADPCQRSCSA